MFRRWASSAAVKATKSPKNARSSNVDASKPKMWGESYKLSDRVKRLAAVGQLDRAEAEVKAASKEAATVVVWNELIRHHLMAKKVRRGWELWMDMKRRGVKPSTRSYVTFFTALRKAQSTGDGDYGIAKIRTIYAQWIADAEKRSTQGPSSVKDDPNERISNIPTNAFLSFLSNCDKIEDLMRIFDEMPSSGPLAADTMTYSTVLSALLRHIDEPGRWAQARDAWRRAEREQVEFDTVLLTKIISVCRESARPEDQLKGLQMAEQRFGLVPPGDIDVLVKRKALPRGSLHMDSAALSTILALCLDLRKLDHAISYFDQVRDHRHLFGKKLLDYRHCDLVIAAHAFQSNPQAASGDIAPMMQSMTLLRCLTDLIDWMLREEVDVKPHVSTFANAVEACEKVAEIKAARRLFNLMLSSGIKPDARVAFMYLSTALSTKDRGEILQVLDALDKNGFPRSEFPSKVPTVQPSSHHDKWRARLIASMRTAVERVLTARNSPLEQHRRRDLEQWQTELAKWLEASGSKMRSGASRTQRKKDAEERPGLGDHAFETRRGQDESDADHFVADRQPSWAGAPRPRHRENNFHRMLRGDVPGKGMPSRRPSYGSRPDGKAFERRRAVA